MSELQAVERHWQQYVAGRFGGPMTPEAELELKMAFYSGAHSSLDVEDGLAQRGTEGQRDAAMADMRLEIREFFYLVQTPPMGTG